MKSDTSLKGNIGKERIDGFYKHLGESVIWSMNITEMSSRNFINIVNMRLIRHYGYRVEEVHRLLNLSVFLQNINLN